MLYGTINQAMFDWPWSGIHFVSGLLIGLALAILIKRANNKLFWIIGVGLLGAWELIEISLHYLDVHAHDFIAPLKESVAGFAFAPETVTNLIGDLLMGSVGLLFGITVIRKTPLNNKW